MSSTDGNTDIFALSTDESHTSATDPFAISRAASGASEDVDAKSDGFISFPGTPVGDGEFSFWDDGDPAVASPRASQGPIFSEPQTPIDGGRSEAQFPTFDDRSQAQASKSEPVSDDTSCPVKGMYPLLDLITEQGSSGLVDKIIIAQRPLQAFINALSPGAYSSITKVNFKTLDNSVLKPVGIYGSKEEIVRFLREINAVDEGLARKLLTPQSVYMSGAEPILRSGLYVVRSFTAEAEEQVYVLYWPEDTTWDDHAVSTIQRNRVTFMRYLTKLCDQLVCLISSEHSRAIVWSDDDDDDASINSENDDSDRMYYFEVAKTTDQEENVTARQGFMMNSPLIGKQVAPTKLRFDPEILKPKLLHSETAQGFMTARFRPAKVLRDEFRHDHQNASQIRLLFKDDATFCLSDGLEDSSLKTLQDLVLEARFPKECEAWQARRKEISKRFQKTFTARRGEMHIALEESSASIKAKLQVAVVREIARVFTSLRRDDLLQKSTSEPAASQAPVDYTINPLADLFQLYPNSQQAFRDAIRQANFERGIKLPEFQAQKEKLLALKYLLDNTRGLNESQIVSLKDAVLRGDKPSAIALLKSFSKLDKTGWGISMPSIPFGSGRYKLSKEEATWRDALNFARTISDAKFLSGLKQIAAASPLHDAAVQVEQVAYGCLMKQINDVVGKLGQDIRAIQRTECDKHLQRELMSEEGKEFAGLRSDFVHQIENVSRDRSKSHTTVYIKRFETRKEHQWSPDSYYISGHQESLQSQEIEYSIHALRLLADQRQNLQLDSSYVPTPVLNERLAQSFRIPAEYSVKYAHLLDADRVLLVLADAQGNIMVFLDRLARIDGAIQSRGFSKFLHQDKVGHTCLFAYDEAKRMLAVYSSARMQLHVFVFDEELKSLRGYGSAIDLAPFYAPGVTIDHASFVHGSEEILFVDSSAQARIFSLITLQPKPASLQLKQAPSAVYSSPDGSCALIVHDEDGAPSVTAYHWSTFASTEGIPITLPDFPVDLDSALLTSIVGRNNVHLIGLDLNSHSCHSIVLDITRKAAEFTFKERRSKTSSGHSKQTEHNCLINCHADVWTRFPVVPAVKRRTITSSSERQRKSIVFVTDDDRRPFSSHFSDIIHAFEKTSRKPTGDELKNIAVSARSFRSFSDQFSTNPDWIVSRFRAGEWLADLLCLIPIQVAITQENRFVPLKDGVLSTQLEKSLLGAEVNRIVDTLSLGWYESIFQSYWASKPVRVVSSMGEQSVGKSFALNHLVDTSFAGSAMRTTEGVWMSVSPTDEALIVALDFEGVHSLERSAQEDTLLVLFNTAISNLVLFRNNFALGRDIASLFQSFQTSSSVLDPAANPSLFQSTLVVIIKDVIESDKSEVTKEFSLKFQKIVQDEQDANFITRLHAGKLQIIPWPVIESKEFYKLFTSLKRRLDQQSVSHRTAGEFLHTMKTLMAKLKANDWGAMSQTMASHRANALLAILPNALKTGFSEIYPEPEPLKNFDTDLVVEAEDTDAEFLLTGPDTPAADREHCLATLRESWRHLASRQQIDDSQWISDLAQYLTNLVDLRAKHVDIWLKSNTQRFQAAHASIEELRRTFDSAIIDLRTSVQLCKSQCKYCNLFCIQGRLHEGDHECLTSHECIHDCSFCQRDLLNPKPCGQPAGHSGNHVCRVDAHLCGERCTFSGKQGCMEECVKAIGHEGTHMCSAPVHICGQPCDLIDLKMPDGKSFTCNGVCHVPINEAHTVHACEHRLCPITCQLCKRLCSGDHLHGLFPDQSHLCGQEHSCSALCSAPGICQIDTTPQSIEATFTGRHETFQYTKYSQAAKRLRCVKIIESGEVEHVGPHIHSNEKQPFHFCESRCETCGYLCTLPLGHTQQEHETRHGSMSRTRWAIDGPDGTSLELEGRHFSANDDGAPMLCNLVCKSMDRHVHIDYCRGDPCDNPEAQHLQERVSPNPDQDKDWITHSLHWRRMGFKDPYSREDQANFAKCDAMCPGPEHTTEGGGANAQPSRCTLSMFHPPVDANNAPAGIGYISNDGHHFACRNPIVMQQAFHVIFVIDRSGSMCQQDRQPLPNDAATARIIPTANDRLGAVFGSLYGFWTARQAAADRNAAAGGVRKDAYSLIFFSHETKICLENDFTSTPDELLTAALAFESWGGTDFTKALDTSQKVMESHWSTERMPIVIFLSDGEDDIRDEPIYDICRSAVRLGRQLSFHAVSFGQDSSSSSLRRMTEVADEVQKNAPVDPLLPAAAMVPSSYTEALDTVRLAETFLGIAESLRKPRGALFASY